MYMKREWLDRIMRQNAYKSTQGEGAFSYADICKALSVDFKTWQDSTDRLFSVCGLFDGNTVL